MRRIYLLMCLLLPIYLMAYETEKTRMIVMTDLGGTDPDDVQSLMHLLLCADRIDIEGLISTQAWIDDADHTDCIRKVVENYRKVYPCLRCHSDGFPTPERLDSIITRGQEKAHISGIGMGKDSDGSDWIIKVVGDNNDNRPVWIAAWGGMNTLAQALLKASVIYDKERFDAFRSKIRIYDILGQDDAGAWIAHNYPDITYIRNKEVYGWAPDDKWIDDNVQGISPFGTSYPDRIWATEGDSPAFMYMYSNGLNVPEHPDWGGWGGRFSLICQKNVRGMDFVEKSGKDESAFGDYYMYVSAPEGVNAINRWKNHIYNDFAARIKWTTTTDYSAANHHPVAVVNGNNDNSPVFIKANGGEQITLDASESIDSDKDSLSFLWQIYTEAGTFCGDVEITGTDSPICSITLPETIKEDDTLHLILAVTDNGTPSLTAYKRIVISPTALRHLKTEI